MVIPKAIRERLGLTQGQKLQTVLYDDRIELIPLQPAKRLRGFLKGIDTSVPRDPRSRMNVVNSIAWLEYFANGPNASFFAAPIEDPDRLVIPSGTVYEVFGCPTSYPWLILRARFLTIT